MASDLQRSGAEAGMHGSGPVPDQDPVRPGRGRYRWLLWWIAGAVMGIGAAVVASQFIVSPWDRARVNAARDLIVTAEVEERTYTPATSVLEGTVSLGTTTQITATAGDAASVVTGHHLATGDLAGSGDALIDISGRPIILLRLPFPLYRDLAPGASGDDVAAVQEELSRLGLYAGAVDGIYGAGTATAVQALYRHAGTDPPAADPQLAAGLTTAEAALAASTDIPGSQPHRDLQKALAVARAAAGTPLPAREILTSSLAPLTVTALTPIGQVLDDQTPAAMTLRGGSAQVQARLPVGAQDAFTPGTPVTIVSTDDTRTTTAGIITQLGEFKQPDATGPAGFDTTIDLTGTVDGFTHDSAVRVQPADNQLEEQALMIPLTALRQDSRSSYVHLAATATTRDGGAEATIGPRVDIETGGQVDGFIIVTSGDLDPGDVIIVTGGSP